MSEQESMYEVPLSVLHRKRDLEAAAAEAVRILHEAERRYQEWLDDPSKVIVPMLLFGDVRAALRALGETPADGEGGDDAAGGSEGAG